jgi:GTP-binding protein
VSRTPGRTREINFFALNEQVLFVDLPGYGYARAPASERRAWRALVDDYLLTSGELRGIVQLLDVRREPSDDDQAMRVRLADLGVPVLFAVTKMDKLGADAGRARVRAIRQAIEADEGQVVPFSARTGLGRDELASAIADLLAAPRPSG